MSRENVALFSQAISKHPEISKRISQAGTNVEEWIVIARDVGFEFTAAEFADVVGQTLGREVTPENAVREYLGAQHTVGDLELRRKTLDTIMGGVRRTITNL